MPDRAADVVFTGGHVYTVDTLLPRAEAIAVHGERISAVGDAASIASAIGPSTRVIDLRGRMLVPGFQDAHVHPLSSGLEQLACDLRVAEGRPAVLETIRQYAAAHPDREWIVGGGWYMGDFPDGLPRREDLDAILPSRPAFFPNRDGHSSWVNSRALELAGITARHGRPRRWPDRARPGRFADRRAPRNSRRAGRGVAAGSRPGGVAGRLQDRAGISPLRRRSRHGRMQSSRRTTTRSTDGRSRRGC